MCTKGSKQTRGVQWTVPIKTYECSSLSFQSSDKTIHRGRRLHPVIDVERTIGELRNEASPLLNAVYKGELEELTQ